MAIATRKKVAVTAWQRKVMLAASCERELRVAVPSESSGSDSRTFRLCLLRSKVRLPMVMKHTAQGQQAAMK